MKGIFKMSNQLNFESLSNATSSPELAAGRSPCALPDGLTTNPVGPVAAPASLSASPAKDLERKTRVTFGRSSAVSSVSAALASSLASRLQARMEGFGSMEYKLTWKHWDMPTVGRIFALRASGRRTSDNDSSGWPTPNTPSGGPNSQRAARGSGGPDLEEVAGWATPGVCDSTRGSPETDEQKKSRGANTGQSLIDQASLAGWRTPTSGDSNRGVEHNPKLRNPKAGTGSLNNEASLAGWPTASSRDWKDTPGMASTGINPDGTTRKREDQLPRVAAMALWGWTTPQAHDVRARGKNQKAKHGTKHGCADLNSDAEKAIGTDTTSSPSATERSGVLNPDHSRWLLGFPSAWNSCGVTAIAFVRKQPRNSSARASKRLTV